MSLHIKYVNNKSPCLFVNVVLIHEKYIYIYIEKTRDLNAGCVGLPVCIAYNISVNPVEMLRC